MSSSNIKVVDSDYLTAGEGHGGGAGGSTRQGGRTGGGSQDQRVYTCIPQGGSAAHMDRSCSFRIVLWSVICQDHAVSPSLAPHSPQPHCCALIRPACTQKYTSFPEAWLHEPASLAEFGMVTACSSICLPGVQAWHCQAYVPLACNRARDCQRKVPVPHLLNLTSKSMLCLLHCCGGRHK